MEDLWAFNAEEVAWSIYRSTIPVISAVGHETDFTIADFVADVRAATPSAAAELAVPDKQEYRRYLHHAVARLRRGVTQKVGSSRQRLDYCLSSLVFTRTTELFCGARQQRVDFQKQRLANNMEQTLEAQQHQVANLAARLNTVSPLATLARGYSVCFNPSDGRVIRTVRQVKTGDAINVRLHQGTLLCQVLSDDQ
jgi:exodeoxyribonuclease VII large subunit